MALAISPFLWAWFRAAATFGVTVGVILFRVDHTRLALCRWFASLGECTASASALSDPEIVALMLGMLLFGVGVELLGTSRVPVASPGSDARRGFVESVVAGACFVALANLVWFVETAWIARTVLLSVTVSLFALTARRWSGRPPF